MHHIFTTIRNDWGQAILVLYFSFLVISVFSVIHAQRRSGSRYGEEDERSSWPCLRLKRLSAQEKGNLQSIAGRLPGLTTNEINNYRDRRPHAGNAHEFWY